MKKYLTEHLNEVLQHLYINPLEKCNLKCRICYTKKTNPILSEKQILEFIRKYNKEYELQTVTFCGGEVFTLKYFPHLVNSLTDRGIFVQIITNGTIDKLAELNRPNFINLIVSIDGLEHYHDKNRGIGNFLKSMVFLKKAIELGYHTEIFSVITKQNINKINEFEQYLKEKLGNITVTYHPRKPLKYLSDHPVSNFIGEIDDFEFLSKNDLIDLMNKKKVFPPKELGCYQVSLASDGTVYGCCESYKPIGKIDDPINEIIDTLKKNINGPCFGCYQAEFMCGIKNIINNDFSHDRD